MKFYGSLAAVVVICGSAISDGPDRSRSIIDRGAIVRGPRDRKQIALVFTADRYAEGATAILDTLATRRIRAAYFLTGRFLRDPNYRLVIERIRQGGHLIGPHSDQHLLYASWDRPPRLLVTRDEFDHDLDANLQAIDRAGIDSSRVRYFLPPFEHYTPEVSRWTAARRLTLVNLTPGTRSHTDYMTDDDPGFVPAAAIGESIFRVERSDPDGLNGFLLLMHLGAGPKRSRDHPYQSLGEWLDALRAKGYTFVRVDELLEQVR